MPRRSLAALSLAALSLIAACSSDDSTDSAAASPSSSQAGQAGAPSGGAGTSGMAQAGEAQAGGGAQGGGSQGGSAQGGAAGQSTGGQGGFAQKDWAAEAEKLLEQPDWYRHAIVYEVYVRSFQDSDGDGIGDLKGLTSRLDYLKGLGVDALWLMPIFKTPFVDSGYDIADYVDVDPAYGTLADLDELIAQAHSRKMRVMLDLVLNHTSDKHVWFEESRQDKTNPKADWYVWSDTPSSPDFDCGTFNPVQFGDDAWKYDDKRGQYYYHRFYAGQPDLNYKNPEVVNATLDVARFWLDRGVDGFRCDVIGLLVETKDTCNLSQPTVDYIKQLRSVLDSYPGRAMVAESTDFGSSAAYFGSGSDMFHMAFNFAFGYFWGPAFGGRTAGPIKKAFDRVIAEYPQGSQDALVIGSHDVTRAYNSAQGKEWRHRRAFDISMFMRGTPFVYYGEELGLRSGSAQVVDMRDSARTPMPWVEAAPHGFTTGTPWLPFGAQAGKTSVELEEPDPASMLSYYKKALSLRRGHAVWGTGKVTLLDVGSDSTLVWSRENDDEAYVVAVNIDDEPATLTLPSGTADAGGETVLGEGLLKAGGVIELPGEGSVVARIR